MALEGVDTAAAVAGTAISEPVTALHQALAASRVVLRNPGGWFVESSPDGSLLATGLTNDSDTEDAVIWEAATSRQIRVLPSADGRSAWTAAFSSDGHSLAVGYEAAGASGPLVVVWEVSTGEVIATFDDPDFNNTGEVDLSADGELLTAVAWGDAGGAVMVWDLDSGAERYRIESVEAPSFSPDGRLLAVAGPTGVTLFDAATGTEAASLEVPADLSLVTTAFDPSGRYLAAVSQFPPVVVIWEIASGEVTASWESGSGPVGLEWNPSGDLIAVSGNDGTPRLYDLTGDEVLSLLGHDSIVWSLAFNPSGDRLAGAGLFGDTLIWDVRPSPTRETATLTTPYPGLVWIVYSTDGDSIVALSDEGGTGATMERMNADTGLVLATMPDQRFQWPAQPIPSPEAELVTSLNTDGSAALNDLQTFEPIISLPEDRYALAVSHDGTRVVLNPIVGEGDAIVAEVGSWEVLATFEPQSSAVFSPDGDLLLGYHGGTGVSIGLFDVATGSSLVNDLGGFAGNFSPDGTVLTAHTPTGGLRLLDVASLQADETAEQALVWEITAHNGPIFSSWFSPDSSLIATMAGDSQLRVWDTRNGNLVADFGTMGGSFPAFHFHPDGKHLIAEDTEGTIQILTLDLDELVDIAISRLTRGFSEGECVTYRIDPCPTLEDIQSGSA